MEKETKTIIFNLKQSWSEISIKDYFEIQDVIKSLMLNDLDKSNNIVSILSGVDLDTIESIPYIDMLKIYEKTKWIKDKIDPIKIPDSIELNGKKFIINKEISKMTTSEYLDFIELSKNEMNMHKILALFIKPSEEKDSFFGKKLLPIKDYDINDHQNFINNNLNIVLAYSMMIFFSKVLKNLIEYIKTYSDIMMKRVMIREKIRKRLGKKPKMDLDGLEILMQSQKKLIDHMTKYMS